ncbi:MAG: hypothetical protein VXX85_03820, partial [Candidatus Margulisiibacteriota bacterium]|nr:hypothetical protein [Candidatus Margulisiibacteriota bacterium]
DIGGLAQNKIAEQKEAAAINQLQAALSNQNSLEALLGLEFDEIQNEIEIASGLKSNLETALGITGADLVERTFGDIGGLAQNKIAEQKEAAAINQLQAALSNQNSLEELAALTFDEIQKERLIPEELKESLAGILGVESDVLADMKFGDIGGLAQSKIAEQTSKAFVSTKLNSRIRGSKARQEYEKKREAAANEKELETTLAENLEWMAGVKKDAAIKMAGKAEELATKALKEADGALGSVELPPQLMDVQTKLDEAQSKLKVAKAELEQINEYFKGDESINKSLQAIDQQLKDLENKKIEVDIKNKTQVALYKAKAASALRHATDPIIDAKSSDNLMSIEGIIASLKEVDANLTEAKQGFQPTNQEYKDIEQKMAEIKPLLNELEIKQAEKPAQISDPEAEDEGVKQPSVEGTPTVDQDYLDASNFTDVSDAEFIAKLKHELPEIPSYLFAELGNDFESGFSEVLKREFTSMDDFIQQVIDCFDKAAYRGILDGSNQDKLAEKINEVLEQAKLNVFTKLLQEKGIDINYDVQTVADLLSQLKESEPQVHDDIMEMITPQPIEYPEDYDTVTAKNFQALFGVKQTGDSVYLGIDFLSDQEFTYFNNAAQELYVSKKSIEEAEFHSKSMELLARFIKDNRGDELNFTDHPKLSRLFADLPEDKKEQLAIFNEFMKSEDLSIDPVNAFDRAQRVASDFEEKQKVLKDGMGISPDDIVALMNELGKGTKKDKVFDKIHNYIFTKPNPNGNYYFQDPVMKRFAYIIYKLDAYLVKKVIETPGKKKNIRKSSEYVNLVSHLLPEKLVYHTSGNYRPTAQVKELFNSVVRTILDYLNKTTGEDKVSIDRFLVEMKIFGSNQQIEEGGAFYETLSRLNTLTKEEDAYFVHYQVFKDSLEFNKSGFSLNLETTPDFPKSFNLESLPGDSTIQTARAQLETNFKFIETKFREAFVPSFGEIKFEDIMDLFQKNPLGDHIITEQTYAQMTDQVLSLLDEQSQMTFLSDFLYPAITMHIQLNKLKNFKDDQLLKDVLKEEELKHTRHPATSEQIKKLDSKSLQQLLYLSSNGFDINRRNRPSLLNSAQLDAFLSIKKAFDNNTTSLIKLDAGEGKTFLSKIASQLCDITSSPIIHIAPFAQDVTGWAPLPMTNDAIDFSKLENGQHYWVKQNDMMASLKEASDTHSLKNALIFCDEYDRYPDLNKKLDELGCRKRCNMSATDNIEEVNQKVLEAAQKFHILADKATVDSSIQHQLVLLAEISLNKDSFNTNLFNQTIDAITTELVDKESFLHKKLTRLKEKVPNLIARRQNKMDHEFVTRKMTIKEDDDSPAIDSMIDGAKSFKGKKIQFIFQGIEFSARKSGKPGKNELPISKIMSSCEKLYQEGQEDQEGQEVQKALPVYLHLCAPKGMNGFNEGHRITLQYDGTDWTEIDFDEFKKAPQEGTQLTLYDTFTKVGGDFDQFSNKVDYQAIQVAPDALSDESSEPLSKSLLYQECRRARDSSCAINLFMSQENKAMVDDMPEGLLPYTADIEKKSNERVLQARAQRKRSGAEIKLFNATLNQWLAEVQPEPASFKESLQTELKDYANEHVGQYSGFKAPTPVELQGMWNTIFKEKYDERKNKLNKECATKKMEDLKQSFLEIKREVLKSKKDELEKKSGAKETPKLKLKRGADPKEIVILKRIFKKLEWEEPFNIVDIKTRFEEISANLWQAITTREDPARVEFFKTQENIEVRNLNQRQTKNKYNINSLADNITFVLKKDDEFRHNYMGEKSDQQNKFIIGIIEVIKDMLKDDAYDQEHGFERGYQDLDNPKGGAANFNRDRMSRWESMFKKKVDDILSQIEASLLVTKESPAIEFKTEGVESYDYHRALRWKAITNEASPK